MSGVRCYSEEGEVAFLPALATAPLRGHYYNNANELLTMCSKKVVTKL